MHELLGARCAPDFLTDPLALGLLCYRVLRLAQDLMVERGGFEPPKAKPADLQSAPFDRFGTSPSRAVRGSGLRLNFASLSETFRWTLLALKGV